MGSACTYLCIWFPWTEIEWILTQVYISMITEHDTVYGWSCLPSCHFENLTVPLDVAYTANFWRDGAAAAWNYFPKSDYEHYSIPKVEVSSTARSSFSYSISGDGYGGRSRRLKQVWALEVFIFEVYMCHTFISNKLLQKSSECFLTNLYTKIADLI